MKKLLAIALMAISCWGCAHNKYVYKEKTQTLVLKHGQRIDSLVLLDQRQNPLTIYVAKPGSELKKVSLQDFSLEGFERKEEVVFTLEKDKYYWIYAYPVGNRRSQLLLYLDANGHIKQRWIMGRVTPEFGGS